MENINEKAALAGAALTDKTQANSNIFFKDFQHLTSASTPLETALLLANIGIPSFPCNDAKIPTCPRGFKAATKCSDDLERLWKKHRGSLIGVPTGAVSGFDVLDIDPRHGGDIWLNANSSRIPPTRTHRTRSGGCHFLFRHHAGMRNSASKLADGIDVRADGGYIIWWPGTGLKSSDSETLAEWPKWVLEAISPPPKIAALAKPRLPIVGCEEYIQAAIRNAMQHVAFAPEGQRNSTLYREAYSLGRLIERFRLQPQAIAVALSQAALAAGLEHKEIIGTIASALRARGV